MQNRFYRFRWRSLHDSNASHKLLTMSQQDRRLSALPSVLARVVAFVSIIVAGFAGALIGFTLIDLQCQGACDVPSSIGLILGAITGAFGMGVVAVLVLRATGEWKELEDRK